MKLALHRSITFWSGILVTGFICWAWWDSTRQWTAAWAEYFRGSNVWGGLLTEYRVSGFSGSSLESGTFRSPLSKSDFIRQDRFPKPHFFTILDVSAAEQEILDERIVARSPFTMEERMKHNLRGAGAWALFIPHWLIMLAVALPWSALLLWRARRSKRAVVAV